VPRHRSDIGQGEVGEGEIHGRATIAPVARLDDCASERGDQTRSTINGFESAFSIGVDESHGQLGTECRIKDRAHRTAIEGRELELAVRDAQRAQCSTLAWRIYSTDQDRAEADGTELAEFATHLRAGSLDAIDEHRAGL
jgi:hypothetical protein